MRTNFPEFTNKNYKKNTSKYEYLKWKKDYYSKKYSFMLFLHLKNNLNWNLKMKIRLKEKLFKNGEKLFLKMKIQKTKKYRF